MRARILATLDLFEAGVDMKRQALRREHRDLVALLDGLLAALPG